jgi:hypothetical protein
MAKPRNGGKPVQHSELTKRSKLKATGEPASARVSLLDISLKNVRDYSLSTADGRLLVTADIDARGVERRRRHDTIPTTRLRKKDIDPELGSTELDGFVPSGVPVAFKPRRARRTHALKPDARDVDQGGTIFDSDDRYLFDDLSFPWRTTGKVRTVGKWGSGVTIGPRHVLTASHVINWTGGEDGGVAWVTFSPGYFDGNGPWGEIAATRVVYWIQAPDSSLTSRRRSITSYSSWMSASVTSWAIPVTARMTRIGTAATIGSTSATPGSCRAVNGRRSREIVWSHR